MSYYVYILQNSDGRLYIGQTNNINQRLKTHQMGRGAKFVKLYNNFRLVYQEECRTRAEAMSREKQLKGWTRAKKEALIKGDLELLKSL